MAPTELMGHPWAPKIEAKGCQSERKFKNDGQNVSTEPSWDGPVRAPEAPVVTLVASLGAKVPPLGTLGIILSSDWLLGLHVFSLLLRRRFFFDLIIVFY